MRWIFQMNYETPQQLQYSYLALNFLSLDKGNFQMEFSIRNFRKIVNIY